MGEIYKFNEVHCQMLKVSGPKKIEQAVEVSDTLVNIIADFYVSAVAGVANTTLISIKPLNGNGVPIEEVRKFDVWFSDNENGMGLGAIFLPDTVALTGGEGAGGTTIKAHTALKHYTFTTNALGELLITMADAAKGTGYICIENPANGTIKSFRFAVDMYGA